MYVQEVWAHSKCDENDLEVWEKEKVNKTIGQEYKICVWKVRTIQKLMGLCREIILFQKLEKKD
jgi:hypothetical protein